MDETINKFKNTLLHMFDDILSKTDTDTKKNLLGDEGDSIINYIENMGVDNMTNRLSLDLCILKEKVLVKVVKYIENQTDENFNDLIQIGKEYCELRLKIKQHAPLLLISEQQYSMSETG